MIEEAKLNGANDQLAIACPSYEELTRKLEELTKEMNQFAYIVSHDLQAPLRTVTGFLELLEKRHGDKLDASARQFIDHAIKGASKMRMLVFDLLEYSRLNTAKREMLPLDLNDVVKEVQEKLKDLISEANCTIQLENLPVIMADKKQMIQLFQQLLQNAIKFRSEKDPQIIFSSLKQEDGTLVVSVKDNGMGIEEIFLEKIFIIFRRLQTDEVKYPGSGSGLAICKKIMELHEGTIYATSVKDEGTTFWLNFPTDQS